MNYSFKIESTNISKRYQNDWIFKNLSFDLSNSESLSITGKNGSGKSTLIKCLLGLIQINNGEIIYKKNDNLIVPENWYLNLSFAAPYLELPEEFTLKELLNFHFKFKSPFEGISIEEIISKLYLEENRNKKISQFSSGMKQRLKLGIAFFSNSNVIFLDEPTSNLDINGFHWYLKLVEIYKENRILIIGSNEPKEYSFCKKNINIDNFK
ncbi:MAG: ABC transporter ATP-binding protein [Cyclobacterium sp.]|nr:ABC transporter ATP-binding protein [Cyclobacterium sp.]